MSYGIAQFEADRPTDFSDIILSSEAPVSRSFGCSVTTDVDGENEYNSIVEIMSDEGEVLESSETALKAMVHISDEKNFAEVIYGNTIWPIPENRFFTNVLDVGIEGGWRDESIVAGFVYEDID